MELQTYFYENLLSLKIRPFYENLYYENLNPYGICNEIVEYFNNFLRGHVSLGPNTQNT